MRKLIAYALILAGYTSYTAQTSSKWVSIDPGYPLNYGSTRLIAKQSCVYLFNSNYSTLLRSANNGQSWEQVTVPSDSAQHEYLDMTFVNDSVGYVVGYEGSQFSRYGISSVVKKTSDRGLTWQTVKNGILNNSILTHITFLNENYGIAFGTGKMRTHRFVTEDAGQSWTYLPNFGPDMDQVNYSNFTGQEGVVAGVGHYLHLAITQDEGSTWTTRHFHGSSSASAIRFFDGKKGVITVNDSIFSTYDAALTFPVKNKFPYARFIKSFDMLDMQRGFFCTDHQIYYTADGGASWTQSYSNPALQLVAVTIAGSNVYATTCGSNTLLKLDISELTVGLAETSMGQAYIGLYPNPASDKVYVNAPEKEQLSAAVIYDQLGRLVRRQALTDTKTIDTRELSAGAYLVHIYTDTQTHVTKLIIQQK